jgi:hypothetical protein
MIAFPVYINCNNFNTEAVECPMIGSFHNPPGCFAVFCFCVFFMCDPCCIVYFILVHIRHEQGRLMKNKNEETKK